MVLLLVLLLGVALVWAAYGDLRTRIIPNWLTLGIALAAPLWWAASGASLWPHLLVQCAQALVVFLLFAGLFALGAMGGGDVKLIAALALWLPLGGLLRMLVAMALLGGAVTLATLVWHRRRRRTDPVEIPYGVAISLAGLWVFTNQLLTNPVP